MNYIDDRFIIKRKKSSCLFSYHKFVSEEATEEDKFKRNSTMQWTLGVIHCMICIQTKLEYGRGF